MTLADDVRERVRSYLIGQGEQKTFSQLREVVDAARADFLAELEGVSEAQAAYQPREGGEGEGAWGIAQVVRHLIQSEEGVARRVRTLALGGAAETPQPGRLAGHEDADLPSLIEALKGSRQALLQAVADVEGSERLDTTSAHPFFGELNCRSWFLFQRVHDGDHMRQVQKTKSESAYPKE